ncbi:MAG: TonB-dependent receptor [Porphyromonas sp.]|nr:TonB-dependent receptor [Porphyromonas sp.]
MSHSGKTPQFITTLLFVLFIGSLSSTLSAQNSTYKVEGRILSPSDETVIGATVRLMLASDTLQVKGAASNLEGQFVINQVKEGDYIVRITYLGLEPYQTRIQVKEALNLGDIKMERSAKRLDELEVTASVSPVVFKEDTVQFNTDAFRVQEGASVETLLRQVPGIEIDKDGRISYNGEEIEKIELDGKEFFSSDPTIATRNLPSDMLRSVQVYDKKSDETTLTGMDKGDRTKTLNLKVKPDRKHGVMGNASVGYGTSDRYNASTMVNYITGNERYTLLGNLNNIAGVSRGRGDETKRSVGANYSNSWSDKLDLSVQLSYSDDDRTQQGTTTTENFLGSDRRSNLGQRSYENNDNNKSASAYTRLEWKPTKETTIFFIPQLSWGRGTSQSGDAFNTQNAEGVAINKGSSYNYDVNDNTKLSAFLHFSHKFNEAGRLLYMSLSGSVDNSEGEGLKESSTEFFLTGKSEILDQQLFRENDNSSYSVAASYLEPFSEQWALQLNYRLNLQNRTSDQRAYNKDNEGSYTLLDETYTRSSTNYNRTQRLGLQMRYSFGEKNQLFMGFDALPTYNHTTAGIGMEEVYNESRTVWNAAPSAMLDYRPNDEATLHVRYNGRTSQPSMMQLNPVKIINSALSQTVGNPDLNPSFTHNLNVRMRLAKKEQRLNVELFGRYRQTNNAIISRRTIDPETEINENTYENVNGIHSASIGLLLNTPIGGAESPWTSFTFGNLSYSKNKGFVNDALNASTMIAPNITERISWKNDDLQINLSANGRLQRVNNSISTNLNRRTFDYSISNDIVWQLPKNITLTSNLRYQDAVGYTGGIERHLWLWDVNMNYSFLKGNKASLELSAKDLLRQRSTYSRRITSNAIIDETYSGTSSYVMLTFTYRFNSFGGGVIEEAPSRGGRRMQGGYRMHRM